MGCDIHACVEIQLEEDGPWIFMGAPSYLSRCYGIFYVLAEVRGPWPTLTPSDKSVEGCPDDASYLTKKHLERWDGDAHTIRHMDAKDWVAGVEHWHEVCKAEEADDARSLYYMMNEYTDKPFGAFDRDPDFAPCKYHKIRVIFWFDN